MQTFRPSITTKNLLDSGEALVAVAAITALLLIVGRATLAYSCWMIRRSMQCLKQLHQKGGDSY